MTFSEIAQSWRWKPIRNCPGRYLLERATVDLSPEQIVGPGVSIRKFNVVAARDTVLVAKLDEGGLISYLRADGSYIHTLNDEAGFRRKLEQLGLANLT